MLSTTATAVLIVALLSAVHPTTSTRCTTHAECGSPESPSLCARTFCIPLSIRQSDSLPTNTRQFLIPLEDLINQVNRKPLSLIDRARICRSAANVLANSNPHRYFHLNRYGVDPAARLHALADTLAPNQSVFDFHMMVRDAFASMNDLHSTYLLPEAIQATIGVLGFTTSRFYTQDRLVHYMVSDVIFGFPFSNPAFTVGSIIISVDSIPVAEAVRRLGRAGYGASASAKFARGTDALSSRLLALDPVPREPWSVVKFIATDGTEQEVSIPWVFSQIVEPVVARMLTRQVEAVGSSDEEQDEWHARFPLPRVRFGSGDESRTGVGSVRHLDVAEEFQYLFSAEVRITSFGAIGVLTLPSFVSRANDALMRELTRVLSEMPEGGLVIDVRNNPGGNPDFAKAVTELYSNVSIGESAFQIRATELNKLITNGETDNFELRALGRIFRRGLSQALRVGEPFVIPSGDLFAISTGTGVVYARAERAYFGPVVTVMDGRTYSSGEVFVSIQRDLHTSLVIGVDNSTGGGAASAVRYSQLHDMLPEVFESALGGGVDFTSSYARFFRIGKCAGVHIEGVGVEADVRYFPTKKDVLHDDFDLFEFAGKTLSSKREGS